MDFATTRPADRYINRELSLLEFNRRVLAQAADPSVPVLERLRFLCISSTNLDEFFEVRVASFKQLFEIDAPAQGPDEITPGELLAEIRKQSLVLVRRQYELLNDEIFPSLADSNIYFPRREDWTREQKLWLRQFFHNEIVPVLTPLTLDPSRPFPRTLNKSLNFIVRLNGEDAFGRQRHRAIVQAPRSLPRVIRLPEQFDEIGASNFVFLSSIIHEHVDELFPGMSVDGSYQFRATRNSNLYVDDEEVQDLVRSLEGQLAASRYGAAVRLEISDDCPEDLCDFLLDHFSLEREDLYTVDGPVNLNRLAAVCDMAGRPDLCFAPFAPGLPTALKSGEDIFSILQKKNVLLHHPYQSFAPVVDFIATAAADPKVLAIKQTLYRTGFDSPIVDHLVKAARAGKEVTVVVELMARFDEAANISLANRLQEAGAHVVYGLVGFKAHAKMSMVVRREQDNIRRYVHLGTGNYHPGTARLYTDYGYFSSSRKLGEDVHKVFLQLTSLTDAGNLNRILTAPFALFDAMKSRIEREIEHAEAGRDARIIVKVNALIEPQIIDALYRASAAGVKIDLIVRGMCALRPGIEGLSENISVRSIVGRFLEHSRVYYFLNGGNEEFLCSSADWMDRNFFHRTEVCFPIRQRPLKDRLKADLELFLADNCQAWKLLPDGRYEKILPGDEPAISAQSGFLQELAATSQQA
ncbi:MAG: polyphosphate kinase 1 [Gammaproteobacteria bacterium]|nr:polyphosphate kinase 1 [Gammaproteobacteria bacterium]MDH4314189.1 polyphosphate kinase 1 [Gammaproteobacteria bacterium]MDH5500491.1 polyphosphate kinase 1 [Gammaproteobacteria bacterium]